MKAKVYSVDSAEFMLQHRTYKGEPITGLHEINGKIHLFTPNHVYIVRKRRWYERLWNWLRADKEGMKK